MKTSFDPSPAPLCLRYHLYFGYDAGVYGYGWSDVFAADLFHSMQISQEGALSSATGQRLRKEILAPCATKSGDETWMHGNGMAWDGRIGSYWIILDHIGSYWLLPQDIEGIKLAVAFSSRS